MTIQRRTKIVATIGPGTDKGDVLEQMILAGVNVVRLNFSHGSPEDHIERARRVREISEKYELYVALLGDLHRPLGARAVRVGRPSRM